jgi:hypothetical protein
MAVSDNGGTVDMPGNLARDTQQVRVRPADAAVRVRLRLLDQQTIGRATMDPQGFPRGGEKLAVRGGTTTVTLNSYGVARLDIRHE